MGVDLLNSLRLSAIGLSLTFLALGLLILVMVLLLRLFPDKSSAGQIVPELDSTKAEDDEEQRLEEMAVALAVSICLLESRNSLEYRDPFLGKLLEQ